MKIFIILASLFFCKILSQKFISNNKKQWLPKIIWTWWGQQIEESDHKLKIFDFNHKFYSKGWQIRNLNSANQQQWVSKIPNYNNILESPQFKNTSWSRKSDLIRLLLIKHFGGVYIDYSILLTQSLDWVLNINNNIQIQNKFNQFPDVLLLHNSNHGSQQYIEKQRNNKILYRPTFQSFFIAAKPQAKFIQQWLQKFIESRILSYKKWGNDIMKSVSINTAKQNKINIFGFYNAYFQQRICAQIVLQMKQKQLDAQWEKDKSKPRQFSIQYYNIWSMSTKYTAYAHQQIPNFTSDLGMEEIFCMTIEENKNRKTFPKYLLKFDNYFRTYGINRFWLNQTTLKTVWCPIKNYILQDSIGYEFALKNYPVKFYSNPVVKKPQVMTDCNKIQNYPQSATNKTSKQQAIDYFKRTNRDNTWIPKIVWTWWATKIAQDSHEFKIFDFNRRKYAKGWQIRNVDNTNQQYWLSQIPDYNNVLHSQFFKDTPPSRKSDLVRLLLVKHFGGIYVDYTMFLTQSLDWLLEIQKSPIMTNKFGQSPDVLLIHNSFHGSQQFIQDYKDQNGNKILYRPTYENFLIAAKPGAEFTQLWYQKYVWVRNQSYKKWGNDYMKSIITQIINDNNIADYGYQNPYWQQDIIAIAIIRLKQQEFDRQWRRDKSNPRKFAVQFYKAWSLDTTRTAFSIHEATNYAEQQFLKRIFQLDIQENIKLKSYPKYFLKITHNQRGWIERYWINKKDLQKVKCPNNKFILQNSLGYQCIVKDYPTKFYYNQVVVKIQNNTCWIGKQIQNKTEIQNKNVQFNQSKQSIKIAAMQNKIQNLTNQLKQLQVNNKKIQLLQNIQHDKIFKKLVQKEQQQKQQQSVILSLQKKIYEQQLIIQQIKKQSQITKKNMHSQLNDQINKIAIKTLQKSSKNNQVQILNQKILFQKLKMEMKKEMASLIQTNNQNSGQKDQQKSKPQQKEINQIKQFYGKGKSSIYYFAIIVVLIIIIIICIISKKKPIKNMLNSSTNQHKIINSQIYQDQINNIQKMAI